MLLLLLLSLSLLVDGVGGIYVVVVHIGMIIDFVFLEEYYYHDDDDDDDDNDYVDE